MSDFYVFEAAAPSRTAAGADRYVALFASSLQFNAKEAEDKLVEFLAGVRAPSKMYLIGFEPCRDGLLDLARSSHLHVRLPLGAGNLAERIHCLCFDSSGMLRDMDGTAAPADLVRMLRNDGLREMFLRHKGMVVAKPNTHFVKPSGDHADRFIRVGNVLRHGDEIAFMAAWLLPHLKATTTFLQCDSATIVCLAYALITLKHALDPTFAAQPRVRSFGSYAGLENEFPEPSTSLILISASTTSRLTSKLLEESAILPENIVTLYSLPAENLIKASVPETPVLCRLDWEPDRTPGGFAKIRNQPARECTFCRTDHSQRINISADTFIPEAPEVHSHTVTITDRPEELVPFLDLSAGRGVVRCYYRSAGSPLVPREIHLNAARLFDSERFKALFIQTVAPQLVTGPELVIRLNDEASAVTARTLVQECAKRGHAAPEMIDYQQAVNSDMSFVGRKGPIWVVSSAMVGGRRLSDISRKLRGYNGQIIYLCAVTRTSLSTHLKELRNNLVLRAEGPPYPFLGVANIHLPRPTQRMAPWTKEFEFLKTQRASGRPLSRTLAQRYEVLRAGSEGGEAGLANNLFWKSPKDAPLVLRPNFAFYSPAPEVKLSQADVYLVVTSILHKLRNTAKPLQLLSPGNFDRFNDGVIQAALLRAARAEELNYTLSEFHSDYICDLMCFMLHEPMGEHSEALPEFIWALVDQKLQLTKDDYKKVMDEIGRCGELPAYLKELATAATPPKDKPKRKPAGRVVAKRRGGAHRA